ncbi:MULTISPECIES: anthranilate phosphoribosyltransferase family protein [unclassified Prochlorococcus]|uniref:anthranilate phosphoribosyltransferase family protein n=1 Tax=unclassified Prochlorococcus TaxID=2627481 RepID=UPI0005338E44|nr:MULTISPECIES: anthranilate phosphoribosyltransferase family protein [unclassified Prochlorococcus]KGG14524.1 Anthranilate phosphoribosyltransferase [Prochlorococcus sp. MIT 0602]KGG16051.1 Anthranilate phosphoribosyltransferase [Prochlorococcus sp. MIT 0603]
MNKTSANRERFKNYLRKIGSGEKTSRGMTREEAADALELILLNEPSPAQIGAFLIAHRIRRPEPQELAGMVDTYIKLGPNIVSSNDKHPPISFGIPFDGRTKTSPIYPLTTLLLLDSLQPVILQGSGRMPPKYGVTTNELFQVLGLSLQNLSIEEVQRGFDEHGLAMIFQQDHFPLAESLISYREDLGKRPPIASMELIWSAHQGKHLLISGYVHPPTENRHIKTFKILGEDNILMIQGLEGGIDLPIGKISKATHYKGNKAFQVKLNPKDYSFDCKDLKYSNINQWRIESLEALDGKGPLYESVIWNTGVYLWFTGKSKNILSGVNQAKQSIKSGSAKKILEKLIKWRKKYN